MTRSTTPPSARELARQVLWRVRRDQAYAQHVLGGALEREDLDPRDRALCTELVYGVLRHQRWIDHALCRHATRGLPDDDRVRDILRLGAYQQLFLQRIPAHAAVDDAVGAVRRLRGAKLAGFANALLRRLGPEDLQRDLPGDPLAALAVRCSLPDELAAHLVSQLGLDEARCLALAWLERPALCVRCNAVAASVEQVVRRLTEEGAQVARGTLASQALHVSELGQPFSCASYLDGLWTAQDEGAQLAVEMLDPRAGEWVIDLCAGLGGKATQIAATGARVLAIDPNATKLRLLEAHRQRLRLSPESIVTRQADARIPAVLDGQRADRLLVDAPCSGLGVLRRHPELKWREPLRRLPELCTLQRELLAAGTRALGPGGVLVYSVCTTTEEEGPQQVAWAERELPLALLQQRRLWPHRDGGDGFFIARFVVR